MPIDVIYHLVLKFLRYLKKCRNVILLKKIFFRKMKFFSTGIPQKRKKLEKFWWLKFKEKTKDYCLMHSCSLCSGVAPGYAAEMYRKNRGRNAMNRRSAPRLRSAYFIHVITFFIGSCTWSLLRTLVLPIRVCSHRLYNSFGSRCRKDGIHRIFSVLRIPHRTHLPNSFPLGLG